VDADDVAERQALAVDEHCEVGAEDGACALSALQMRSLKQQTAEVEEAAATLLGASDRWGYCSSWMCASYQKGLPCQCNEGCKSHGNCCQNRESICGATSPSPPEESMEPVHAAAAPVSGNVYGHPTPGKSYPQHPGFTLMLVEEFEEPIDLDTDPIWTWSDGGLIEGQIRFVKDNIVFRDGKMCVEVRDEPAINPQLCSAAEVADIPAKKMTSGEMRTRYNMFRYGRYEARMKAPSVQPHNTKVNGNYVSTMFVYRDAKYKHWREIDFEITGDDTGTVTTNVLSADNTVQWRAGIQESVHHTMSFNDRDEFHDYAFEWTPHKITWYIDGKMIREYSGGPVKIPDMSGKIMMNMWMFDDRALFGGPEIQNNRYPMHNEYEWFRFYKWNGDNQYPCPGMGASCLTPDDKYLAKNNPCDGIAQEGLKYGQMPCSTHC